MSPDPSPDVDLDPEPDPDPEPDIESEPGCVPESSEGECNVVDQCGCPPGAYCSWGQTDSCTLYEYCHFASRGTVGHGSECDDLNDCAPGHDCIFEDTTRPGLCYKWCRESSECPDPSTCTTEVLYDLLSPCTGEASYPIDACSIP
jgi:hypothetical protein